MISPAATVCIIGFDEASATLIAALARQGVAVRCHIPAAEATAPEAAAREDLRARILALGADWCFELADALRGAKLVISSRAIHALESNNAINQPLQPGQLHFDIQSPQLLPLLRSLGLNIEDSGHVPEKEWRGELP
jgi:hypothetical protein